MIQGTIPKPTQTISALELATEYGYPIVKIRNAERRVFPQYPLRPDPYLNEFSPFSDSFVLTLPAGRLFGREGVVITEGNQLLTDSVQAWVKEENRSLAQVVTMPPMQQTQLKVAVIAAHAPSCYYHWMMDILPRIKLLRESKVAYDKIYIPWLQEQFPFQRNTLERLGIREDELLQKGKETFLKTDEVIFPSIPSKVCCAQPTWVHQFLRDTFSPISPPEQTRKLLISRKVVTSSSQRLLLNEEEVFALLQPMGFERVFLEDKTVEQQAFLFAAAKTIVAAHGAGLTNLVFCQPGTRVVEIFHPNHLDETYFLISAALKLNHHCLLPAVDPHTAEQDVSACNIHLPILKLAQALSE